MYHNYYLESDEKLSDEAKELKNKLSILIKNVIDEAPEKQRIQKVLKKKGFKLETEKAEAFFNCPMSGEQYVEMLIELGVVSKS